MEVNLKNKLNNILNERGDDYGNYQLNMILATMYKVYYKSVINMNNVSQSVINVLALDNSLFMMGLKSARLFKAILVTPELHGRYLEKEDSFIDLIGYYKLTETNFSINIDFYKLIDDLSKKVFTTDLNQLQEAKAIKKFLTNGIKNTIGSGEVDLLLDCLKIHCSERFPSLFYRVPYHLADGCIKNKL